MQFKRKQRDALIRSWHGDSWFYMNLGSPARSIIEAAYELPEGAVVPAKWRSRAQEILTLVVTIFAQRVGCDKSHVVHALLSGSIESLQRALNRLGSFQSERELRNAWESSFRDVILKK